MAERVIRRPRNDALRGVSPDELERLKAGDNQEWTDLTLRLQNPLKNIAKNIVRNHEDAEDVVQESLLYIAKSINNLNSDQPMTPYMFITVKSRALTHLKSQRIRPQKSSTEVEDIDYFSNRVQVESSPQEEKNDFRVLVQKLREGGMSEDFLDALVLKEVEGYEYQEIAEILNIQPATVATRVFRAKRDAKAILEGTYSKRKYERKPS